MLSWITTLAGLRGAPGFSTIQPITYSYGSGILRQAQPVYYSWTTIKTWWVFDASKYIWSDVAPLTGNIQWLLPYVGKVWLIVTWTAIWPVTHYSLFWNLITQIYNVMIDQSTGIMLSAGAGTKTIIAQFSDGNFSATHYENTVEFDNIPPTASILYTPASWAWTSGNVYATITWFSEETTNLNQTWYLFTDNGSFVFTYQDLAWNTWANTATVTWIDKISPIFTGVINGATYTTGVILTFSDNNTGITATINGQTYFENQLITLTGNYVFVISDLAGNTTWATFSIAVAVAPPVNSYIIGYENDPKGSRENVSLNNYDYWLVRKSLINLWTQYVFVLNFINNLWRISDPKDILEAPFHFKYRDWVIEPWGTGNVIFQVKFFTAP